MIVYTRFECGFNLLHSFRKFLIFYTRFECDFNVLHSFLVYFNSFTLVSSAFIIYYTRFECTLAALDAGQEDLLHVEPSEFIQNLVEGHISN